MSVKAFSDPDVLEAKMTEMESWKRFEVYDEIKNEGQRYITIQWVVTQKFNMKGRSVKARLVARGFQEPNEHIIKKNEWRASPEYESACKSLRNISPLNDSKERALALATNLNTKIARTVESYQDSRSPASGG